MKPKPKTKAKTKLPHRDTRRVALLIEATHGYGRSLLTGVARFVRSNRRWRVLYQPWMLGSIPPEWLAPGACDGVLARIDTPELRDALARIHVPVVDLCNQLPQPGIPTMACDPAGVARLALDHFQSRGLRRMAFCGFAGADYSRVRCDAFLAAAQRSERRVPVYEIKLSTPSDAIALVSNRSLPEDIGLNHWLQKLPKPVGILTCNDICGRFVLDACRTCGLRVPDDVAVLGVDNDEILCELSVPPLSSIAPAAERIGYEGAELLDAMMAGRRPKAHQIFIPPAAVIARASTDLQAVDDLGVNAAIRFVRDHACEGINVEDLLDFLAADSIQISRSTLEHRFMQVLGRSPKEEILRVRLDRAKALLRDTEHSISQIGDMVGIPRVEQFSAMFKVKVGVTPTDFRQRARPQ